MTSKKGLNDQDAAIILSEFQDYAYRVSHDLSAPVRAMVEFSKLLEQEQADKLDEEAKEYLSIIIASGHKVQAMMEGLLQFSRLNTVNHAVTAVDLNRVIQQVQVMLHKSIEISGAILTIGELPTINANVDQMILLFKALLDNALKFQVTNKTPIISIAVEKQNNVWQFSLSDNGIGINQQFQDKIFQLFGRLHSYEQYPGVGVGLTLAQKVVKRHSGSIWFESTLNHGSTFYFTLPI